MTVQVRVAWSDTDLGSVAAIDTPVPPAGFPLPQLLASDAASYWADGTYLLGSINQDQGGWTSGRYWMFVCAGGEPLTHPAG